MEEELFVYAILFCEGIALTEERYHRKLDALFLENPGDETLLYLEWETNMKQAAGYIRNYMDGQTPDHERFGRILMENLREYYDACPDIRTFAGRMYGLWERLPGNLQDRQPFWTLSYADDPLSWGDEDQTRGLYEAMLNYYIK